MRIRREHPPVRCDAALCVGARRGLRRGGADADHESHLREQERSPVDRETAARGESRERVVRPQPEQHAVHIVEPVDRGAWRIELDAVDLGDEDELRRARDGNRAVLREAVVTAGAGAQQALHLLPYPFRGRRRAGRSVRRQLGPVSEHQHLAPARGRHRGRTVHGEANVIAPRRRRHIFDGRGALRCCGRATKRAGQQVERGSVDPATEVHDLNRPQDGGWKVRTRQQQGDHGDIVASPPPLEHVVELTVLPFAQPFRPEDHEHRVARIELTADRVVETLTRENCFVLQQRDTSLVKGVRDALRRRPVAMVAAEVDVRAALIGSGGRSAHTAPAPREHDQEPTDDQPDAEERVEQHGTAESRSRSERGRAHSCGRRPASRVPRAQWTEWAASPPGL